MTICTNLSDEQVKMAFSKFDTSGDDKLDYREFCEMIKQKVRIILLSSPSPSHNPKSQPGPKKWNLDIIAWVQLLGK